MTAYDHLLRTINPRESNAISFGLGLHLKTEGFVYTSTVGPETAYVPAFLLIGTCL